MGLARHELIEPASHLLPVRVDPANAFFGSRPLQSRDSPAPRIAARPRPSSWSPAAFGISSCRSAWERCPLCCEAIVRWAREGVCSAGLAIRRDLPLHRPGADARRAAAGRPGPQPRSSWWTGSGGNRWEASGHLSPGQSGGDGEPACRRGSVPGPLRGSRWVAIHLCGLPGDGSSCEVPDGPPVPLLGLAPSGVCRAARVTPDAGALLPHRFTLTCAGPEARHRRSVLCGTFLRVTPTGC